MRIVVKIIDSISEWTGKTVRWSCLALVLVLCYEVTARYVFNAPTIWAHATSCMVGGTIVVLGWAYTYLHQGHVRVDVFYTHLSPRGKAIVNMICAILFFFPLLAVLIRSSVEWLCFSWSMHEVIIATYWYPSAIPMRMVVFLGLLLFTLQGFI